MEITHVSYIGYNESLDETIINTLGKSMIHEGYLVDKNIRIFSVAGYLLPDEIEELVAAGKKYKLSVDEADDF